MAEATLQKYPNANAVSYALHARYTESASPSSVMLNRVLWQQRLRLPLHTRLERRPDQVVEQERSVYKEGKTQHLEPLESLPAQAERHNPDE